MRAKARLRKIADEEYGIRCAGMLGLVREEVWVDAAEQVVRYNLAFVHHGLTSKDNGRVLGYDNRHGVHHRHWYGQTQPVPFTSYQDIYVRFMDEIAVLQETKR